MNHRIYVSIILVLAVLLISTGLEPARATHWASTVDTTPDNVYQGVFTRFTVRVHNAASEILYVSKVWVHFCWQGKSDQSDWYATGYVFFESSLGFQISPLGFYDFTGDIQVPEAISGSCVVIPQVTGRTALETFQTVTYCPDINNIPASCGSINILVPAPLAVSISPNPNVGVAPLKVQFYATVTGGVYPYTYSWTFGDGEISAQKDPLHTYTSSGTWTVTLVVVDSQSRQQSKTTTVTVSPSSSPSPTPTPSPGPTPPPPAPPFWQQYWYLILAAVGVAVAVPIVMRTVKASSAKTHPQPPAGQIPSPARQFCANCGAALSSSESFCSACGKASS